MADRKQSWQIVNAARGLILVHFEQDSEIPEWADRVRFSWYYEDSAAVDEALREKTKAERLELAALSDAESKARVVVASKPGGSFTIDLEES